MHFDVSELAAFYATPLGRIARQVVSAEIRAAWPTAARERLLGLGHATPYLRPYLADAERVVALMPAAEGILHWPKEGPNLTAMAYEDSLPLPDNSVDKVLLVHVLEAARDPRDVLREVWRVLMPTGRALAIAPYRSGAWARSDRTPMGLGRPFSRSQLAALMEDAGLEPIATRRFLFVPPTRRRFVLRSAGAFERIGRTAAPRFAGLVAVEGRKVVVRGRVATERRPAKIFVPALGAPQPATFAPAPRHCGGAQRPCGRSA
jgi:SAM-dependent methyltransferase